VPAAERRRLALAYLLAVAELKAGKAPGACMDALLAAEVAMQLMASGARLQAGQVAARRLHDALHDHAEGKGKPERLARACAAFWPYYEDLLHAVPLQRLVDCQQAVVQRWAKTGQAERVTAG
jgi:hypothetical protein